ncbi:aminoglycoside phosphotransferase [Streptomyces sp. DSM 42041]|uniref:Aminoglycoside phosphotransferase n=1 Tax=Streptomyces hazeniae TaxID=3075538 RepID=A0ABU2NJN1_9ACTN|nr:aminoglycoside phosphotransferase [Streptomyces sp. DSM 42041]MDT0377199.1 aminoglycoside phosphotransferase [Streptomyces sp. DSM 42041]
MAMERLQWEDLPAAARAAVEQHAGRVVTAHSVGGGARILWRAQAAGWDLLGYALVWGRHADYRPGSPDLPLVFDALAKLQATPCPGGRVVKRAEDRWAGYVRGTDIGLLAGDALLHTDLAPHNVLITDRAHLIDWAWPTRGAGWIDPAVWVLRLMEAGHSADDADRWAGRVSSWRSAWHEAVAVFSAANAAAWEEIARDDPQTWKQDMARHAKAWVRYWESRA